MASRLQSRCMSPACVLCENRRYDEAEEMLMKALAIMNAKLGEDDLQIEVMLHSLGACLR